MLKPPTEYVPPPPPPIIDDTVRENALKKLQGLIRGNGAKPETVSVIEAKAQTFSFAAQGFVRLATHYTSRTQPGKIESGEAIGSPAAFEHALKNMTVQTQRDGGKRKTILDIVQGRPDKGYGAREQIIKLDTLSRDFVSHEGCDVCKTTGKTTCHQCSGDGMMTCQNCHGRNQILCPVCRGAGQTNRSGKPTVCARCRGVTRVPCPTCQAHGKVRCKICGGSGATSCSKCNATGWLSHLAHVELIGHLHFDYDRQGLPIELTKLLDAFSSRYIEKKDIEVKVLTHQWDEKEPAEVIPIGYEVRVPYGEITFQIGKKRSVTATALGWNGNLIKASDFLDDLTKRGQEDLVKASNGEGSVGEHLRNAARFRILREAIVLAAGQTTTRKALSLLLQKYPVGLSSDKLLQVLMQATAAMHIITRKPRMAGLSLGTAIFAGLAAVYFLSIREIVLEKFATVVTLNPFLLTGLVDLLLVPIGTLAAILFSQVFAADAAKKTLNGLASPKSIQKILPKIGWTLWAGLALSIAVTGIFYFSTVLR